MNDITLLMSAIRHYNQSEFHLAIPELLELLDVDPRCWEVRAMVAECYLKTGQSFQARGHYQRICAECPNQEIQTTATLSLKSIDQSFVSAVQRRYIPTPWDAYSGRD